MELTRISYSEGATIAGKRFESRKPIVSADATLESGEDVALAMEKLREFVRKHLAIAISDVREDLKRTA